MLRWARGYHQIPEILDDAVRVFPREQYAAYMSVPVDSKGNPYTDRRSDRRQRVLFSSVITPEDSCGRVLDISSKGLALQTDSELVCDEFTNFRFKFSPTLAWVAAKGRVVWRNNAKHLVGIQFVGLTDEVQKQIQTWMDSKKELSGIAAVLLRPAPGPATDSVSATPILDSPVSNSVDLGAENRSQDSIVTLVRPQAETQDAPSAAKSVGDEKPAGGIGKTLRLVGLALAALLLLSVFLPRGLHLQKSGNSQKSREMTLAPNPPVPSAPLVPSRQPIASPPPVPSSENPVVPSSDHNPSLDVPSFVLQVGAMVHEENADALADSLRHKNFPAFVVKRPNNQFHYVLVGPYHQADIGIRVKSELAKDGFPAIRKEWKMPSQ